MTEEDPNLETAFKVVSIMQTVTEELDEKGKRIWRKMLGLEGAKSRLNTEKIEKSKDRDT